MLDCEIFIGWDPRERRAWEVCARSIIRHAETPPPITAIGMATLGGLYKRQTERREGVLYDSISGAPMATEFALARFFVPRVSNARWALFCDADFMFRTDVAELLRNADPSFAVQVVQHRDYEPREHIKMDGQLQTSYPRKNWSSLVLWNLNHAANKALWLGDLNDRPGLWLHQFGWLKDHQIGALPHAWNWLEGSSSPEIEPKAVHYTRGTPDMLTEPLEYEAEWMELAGMHRRTERAMATA